MSNYIVGFDLGTHQTKICIQNVTNPEQKTFEFFKFKDLNKKSCFFLPSVVQINQDETVSYGYVDEKVCLILKNQEIIMKPVLELLEEPHLPIPPAKKKSIYPKKPVEDPWKDSLRKLKGEKTSLDSWKEKCEQLDKQCLATWENKKNEQLKEYIKKCKHVQQINQQRKKIYKQLLSEWKRTSYGEKMQFRYFKLKAFTESGSWDSIHFSAEKITVWYIAYILLLLRKELGYFTVHFGIPIGGTNDKLNKQIKQRAYKIYISADILAKKYNNIEDFLKENYKDLDRKTQIIPPPAESLINEYYFDDFPEAFAGLVSVTQHKRLGFGFHFLVDIGGGTTDIALFVVNKGLPDVIKILSFPKGLNFIFERTKEENNQYSLDKLQEAFFRNSRHSKFSYAVKIYKEELEKKGLELLQKLYNVFIESKEQHRKNISDLNKALNNQPIIYCGGGAMHQILHININRFTDKRRITKEMLGIKNLINDSQIPEELYPILAVSYGLAVYEKGYKKDIEFTDFMKIFNNIKQHPIEHKPEYGLADD